MSCRTFTHTGSSVRRLRANPPRRDFVLCRDNTDLIIRRKDSTSSSEACERYRAAREVRRIQGSSDARVHAFPGGAAYNSREARNAVDDELVMDLEDLEHLQSTIKLLGSKGTTGTQATFLELFGGDYSKVRQLDGLIAEKMGYEACYPVSGQTYSRKVDTRVLDVLAGIAQSAHKFSNDIRLLQNLKEIEEPFEKTQIGSSAMAYKRNPMRSERMASLSRYLICDSLNPAITAATQWFERTLDDSANKRVSISEGFLACDSILELYLNISSGLVVYPKVIHSRLMSELPFMATEIILMDAVEAGGDRQELHEKIRVHSMAAGKRVKEEGADNDLIDRIAEDPAFPQTKEEIMKLMKPENFVGCAPQQTEDYLNDVIRPILDKNRELIGMTAEINV